MSDLAYIILFYLKNVKQILTKKAAFNFKMQLKLCYSLYYLK